MSNHGMDSTVEQRNAGMLTACGYRVIRKLGEGGMAAVYEVVRADDGAAFAAKVLLDRRNFDRFQREYAILKRIRHPAVVEAHDFVDPPDGMPFIIMELVLGTPLGRSLGEPMPWQTAVGIASDVLDALEVVHGGDFIHRDLAPGNIMVLEPGKGTPRAQIIDFGISFDEHAPLITATGQLMGTVHCIAPERLDASAEVDHRADLYAVGVLLYWMIAGHHPHPNLTINAMLAAHVRGEPARLSPSTERPRALLDVIEKAMAKRPEARYLTARAMSEALAAIPRDNARKPIVSRRTRPVPLPRSEPGAPGRLPGALLPGSGAGFRRALAVAVQSVRKYQWPEWVTDAHRERCIASVSHLRVGLRPHLDGNVDVDWPCSRCDAIRTVPLFALGLLQYCERCGVRHETAPFTPLREGKLPVLPSPTFARDDGALLLAPDELVVTLVGEGLPSVPCRGPIDVFFDPAHPIPPVKLVLHNRRSAPLFRPLIQLRTGEAHSRSSRALRGWLQPDERLEFELSALGVELGGTTRFEVGVGPADRPLIVTSIRLRPYPTPEHVVVRVGDAALDPSERAPLRPGEPVEIKIVAPDLVRAPDRESALMLTFTDEQIYIPLEAVAPRTSALRWRGVLPPGLPAASTGRGQLVLECAHALGPLRLDLDVAIDQVPLLEPTAVITDSGSQPPRPEVAPHTTSVTAGALRISGLRVPAETDVGSARRPWRAPTLVAGLRARHLLPIENLGDHALVIRDVRIRAVSDGSPVEWVTVTPARGVWPIVLGRGQQSELTATFAPAADHPPTDSPLMLQLVLHLDDMLGHDTAYLLVARIAPPRKHPAPLIVELGATALRYMTRHDGELHALECTLSGSVFEPDGGIPAAFQILSGAISELHPTLNGRTGRAAIEHVLEHGGGLYTDVTAAFDSGAETIGGPLDTTPILLSSDAGPAPYLARGQDLLDALIRESLHCICNRYRLLPRSIIVITPLTYSDLHLARLYGLFARLCPGADIHLGLSGARARLIALSDGLESPRDRPSSTESPSHRVLVDVGLRATRVSVFECRAGGPELRRARTVPIGGRHLGDRLLAQMWGGAPPPAEQPPTPEALTPPASPPWRPGTRRRRSLFVRPSDPVTLSARRLGAPPPWLAGRAASSDSRPRALQPLLDAPHSAREALARRALRVLVQRMRAQPGDALDPRLEALLGHLRWTDERGERVEISEHDRKALVAQAQRTLTRPAPLDELIDPIIAAVEAIAPADARLVLTGRGHLGSTLTERLRALGTIERCDDAALGLGASAWARRGHPRSPDAERDRLRVDIALPAQQIIIPRGTRVSGGVGYCPIGSEFIPFEWRDLDGAPQSIGTAAIDFRRLARDADLGRSDIELPYPATALKVWMQRDYDAGRIELCGRPVALPYRDAAEVEAAVAAIREAAEPMPITADRLEGNAPLDRWLTETDPPTLDGERPLGARIVIGPCPVISWREPGAPPRARR